MHWASVMWLGHFSQQELEFFSVPLLGLMTCFDHKMWQKQCCGNSELIQASRGIADSTSTVLGVQRSLCAPTDKPHGAEKNHPQKGPLDWCCPGGLSLATCSYVYLIKLKIQFSVTLATCRVLSSYPG